MLNLDDEDKHVLAMAAVLVVALFAGAISIAVIAGMAVRLFDIVSGL